MELQAYTLIAEVVGAVAVVLTLIYLAIQLRQNTKALRTSAYQGMVANSMQILTTLLADPERAQFFLRVQSNPGQITEEDGVRWHWFMLAAFRHWDNLYYQYRTGALETEMWEGYDHLMTNWLQNQAWSEWFMEHEESFSRSLRVLIHDKINIRGDDA